MRGELLSSYIYFTSLDLTYIIYISYTLHPPNSFPPRRVRGNAKQRAAKRAENAESLPVFSHTLTQVCPFCNEPSPAPIEQYPHCVTLENEDLPGPCSSCLERDSSEEVELDLLLPRCRDRSSVEVEESFCKGLPYPSFRPLTQIIHPVRGYR